MVATPKRVARPAAAEPRLVGGLSEIFGVTIDEGAPAVESPREAASERTAVKTTRVAREPAKTKPPRKPLATRGKAAKAPAAKAVKAPATARRRTSDAIMTRKELLARGLPASTLQGWLRRRILVPTAESGVYVLTDEARMCLVWYR